MSNKSKILIRPKLRILLLEVMIYFYHSYFHHSLFLLFYHSITEGNGREAKCLISQKSRAGNNSQICSICWCLWCKHSHHSGFQGTNMKLKLQYFGHPRWRTDSLEKTLILGKTEGGRRGWQRMRWLDGISNSKFEQAPGVGDGQGGLACCSPWGYKESDTTEQLNWTEHDAT